MAWPSVYQKPVIVYSIDIVKMRIIVLINAQEFIGRICNILRFLKVLWLLLYVKIANKMQKINDLIRYSCLLPRQGNVWRGVALNEITIRYFNVNKIYKYCNVIKITINILMLIK